MFLFIRPLFTSQELSLAAYKAKPKKTVLVLSTEHNVPIIEESSPKKKPDMIIAYNNTKFGVDTCDQMLRYYSTKSATRRWPLSAFYNLLDILCLNTFIIAKEMKMKSTPNRREFLLYLGKQLCTAKAKTPANQPILPTLNKPSASQSISQRVRCHLCKRNKTRETCCSCSKFVCGSCSKTICGACD